MTQVHTLLLLLSLIEISSTHSLTELRLSQYLHAFPRDASLTSSLLIPQYNRLVNSIPPPPSEGGVLRGLPLPASWPFWVILDHVSLSVKQRGKVFDPELLRVCVQTVALWEANQLSCEPPSLHSLKPKKSKRNTKLGRRGIVDTLSLVVSDSFNWLGGSLQVLARSRYSNGSNTFCVFSSRRILALPSRTMPSHSLSRYSSEIQTALLILFSEILSLQIMSLRGKKELAPSVLGLKI